MAEKQINIVITGDTTLQKNVEQSEEIYKNIQSSYDTWQKFGKTEPLANQDKIIEQLKTETKLLEQVNKQIVIEEKTKQALIKTEKENLLLQEKKSKGKKEELQLVELEKATLNDLKNNYKLLVKEYNNLTESQRENTEQGKKLTAQLSLTSQKIKEGNEAVGNYRDSVGDYGRAITKNTEQLKDLITQQNKMNTENKQGTQEYKDIQLAIIATTAKIVKYRSEVDKTELQVKQLTTQTNKLDKANDDLDFKNVFSGASAANLLQNGIQAIGQEFTRQIENIKSFNTAIGELGELGITQDEIKKKAIELSNQTGISATEIIASYKEIGIEATQTALLQKTENDNVTNSINRLVQNYNNLFLAAEGNDAITNTVKDLSDFGIEVLNTIKTNDELANLFENLKDIFSDVFGLLGDLFSIFDTGSKKTSTFSSIIDVLATTTNLALLPIRAVIEAITWLVDGIKSGIETVKNFVTNSEFLTNIFDKLKSAIDFLIQPFEVIIGYTKDLLVQIGLISSEVDALTAEATENTITNYRKLASADAEATDDIKDQLAERAAAYQEYIDKINDLEQLRINSLEDGFLKEADQVDLNYKILREKYKGQTEALLYIELAYENEVKALRTEFYGDEAEAIERITGLADPKNAATEINKYLKKVAIEAGKTKPSELDSLLMQLFKVEGDDLDKLKVSLNEIYNALNEGAQAVFDLRTANLENKLSETEALKEANESELQSEQDKLTELQSVVDEQSGIEKQRTQNQINAANERIAAKKKEQIELENQEKLYQEKIKKQQKIAIYTQLAIDTASSIGSLVKYSEGNPANLLTGGIAGQLQLAAGLITIFSNMANARAQIKKLRKGGKLTGATHEFGGIPLYEAEGDEFVTNRKDANRLSNTLEAGNRGADFRQMQQALNKDFGQDVLKQHNLNIGFDTLELKRQNRRLHLNNQYLKRLVNIAEKEKQTVAIGDTIIEISKNSIKKTRMK